MKLISLYIENFGGLSRFSLTFESGITTVAEQNGFGKTTLAEFIRAMFYGFPRKSKTLEKSLRQKYAPWNGGQYGGNLVFEYQGQCYRVERMFGANPKADTLRIVDLASNKMTARFGDEPGLALFELDADSFERSIYLPQAEVDGTLATTSILSKLTELVEADSDVGNFDKALAALKSKRSTLLPYRGSGGAVAETAAKITKLQLELQQLQMQETNLIAAQEEMQQAQQDVQLLEEQLLQTAQQLQTASRQAVDIQRQQQYRQLCARCEAIEEKLRFYKGKYPKGLPQEDTLLRAEAAALRLKDDLQNAPSPAAAQLTHGRRLYEDYIARQREEAELRHKELQSEKSKLPLVLTIAGIAAILAGAALGLVLSWLYGAAVAGIGIPVLTAAVILKRKSEKRQQEQARLRADAHRQAEQAVFQCRSRMDAFLAQFGLSAAPAEYPAALAELEQLASRQLHRKAETETAQRAVRAFLESLGVTLQQNPLEQLQQIRMDLQSLQKAQTLLEELSTQISAMENQWGDILFADFSATGDPRLLAAQERKLRADLTGATTRLLYAQQNVQSLRSTLTRVAALRDELENHQKKLDEARENVQILDATIEFLQQAKENLATAYMETIRNRFDHYLSMLEGDDREAFLFDSDLQVQLQRQGQSKELAYFSAGQVDLVLLCMRFALVDALFRKQPMIVILDDPFVNLDDAHMEKARKLLHMLSGNHQILYLTCHSSRKV